MELGGYIGPLPVWGWVAVGGGGFLLWKHHQSSSGSGILGGLINGSSSTDTVAQGDTGADNSVSVSQPAGSSAASQPAITDNNEWGRAAINELVASGIPATQADYAVRNYLAGQNLDPSHNTLIDMVEGTLGAPPELGGSMDMAPAVPTPNQPKPTNTGGTNKHHGSKHNTGKGSTHHHHHTKKPPHHRHGTTQ